MLRAFSIPVFAASFVLAAAACTGGPGSLPDPNSDPSSQYGLLQSGSSTNTGNSSDNTSDQGGSNGSNGTKGTVTGVSGGSSGSSGASSGTPTPAPTNSGSLPPTEVDAG